MHHPEYDSSWPRTAVVGAQVKGSKGQQAAVFMTAEIVCFTPSQTVFAF